MKANHQNFKGVKGRSGRHPVGVEHKYFEALDRAVPKAVEFCELLIKEAIEVRKEFANLPEGNPLVAKAYWEVFKIKNELGSKAANTLIGKAPQRVVGTADDGAFIFRWDK